MLSQGVSVGWLLPGNSHLRCIISDVVLANVGVDYEY